jgi:hypothetical protein
MRFGIPVNKIYAVLVAVAVLSSCGTIEKKLVEVFTEDQKPAPKTWKINAINLEERMFYLGIKDTLPDTLIMLGSKYDIRILGQNEAAEDASDFLLCDLWVREKTYTKGLDTINSVTALLSLSDPQSKKVVVRALYTEESQDTLKSYQHLYLILEELFKNIRGKVWFQ